MTLDQLHTIATDAINSPDHERALVAALAMCSDLAPRDYLRGSVAHLLKFSARKDPQ